MTEQQIKKTVELAEGFNIMDLKQILKSGSESLYLRSVTYLNCSCSIDAIREWEHYPLLLYRAMEEFGNTKSEVIVITFEAVCILEIRSTKYYYFKDYTPTPYLTAQEQALEAALTEVL